MNVLSVIGLIVAVLVLGVGAYRGLGALTSTLLASLVVIFTNGMGIWEGLSSFYMEGYTGAYANFFLMFSLSSLYAHSMNVSGSANAIAYQFIDWFGKKNVLLVCLLITSVLTYGGVSLFVVVYAVAPIMFTLFKESNLPRHLTMAVIVGGAATYTMIALPGTPSLTNVIPTQFLGTSLTAAPVFGILASIVMFGLIMAYLKYSEKKARAANEGWSYPEGVDLSVYAVRDRSELPSSLKAFIPMFLLIGTIIIGSQFALDSTMVATGAMFIGTVATYLLNLKQFKELDMKKVLSSGLEGGISGIGGYAGVVAFGTVVANSTTFESIVQWVLSLDMNPYAQGAFATMVVSAVTGSSSGGLRIMFGAFTPDFIASGVNLDLLHRLVSISAAALDTLPHSPGLFLMFSVLGLTHKQGYKHVFWTSIVITSLVTLVSLAILIMFF